MVPVAINQDMKALLPKKKVVPTFLRWLLQALHPILLSKVSTAGHGTKKLDIHILEELLVPDVPLILQERFALYVTKLRELESGQADSRSRLDAGFRAILHRAFAGELQ